MAANSLIGELLLGVLSQFPLLLVYVLGLVIAITRISSNRRAASLTSVAMLLFLFRATVLMGLTYWIPGYIIQGDMDPSMIRFAMMGVGFLGALFEAIAVVLLLVAVFGGAARPQPAG